MLIEQTWRNGGFLLISLYTFTNIPVIKVQRNIVKLRFV